MTDRAEIYHTEQLIERLTVVIDIKSTGSNARDVIVAIGICATSPDRKHVYKYRVGIKLRSDEEIAMMNKDQMSWSDLWVRKGYDLRCFDRFWKSRLDKLDKIQNGTYIRLVKSNRELAFEINRILKEIEERCKTVDIVTNTTNFDTVQVGRILADEQLQPLHYSRDGVYRWTYHSKSYLLGLWGGDIATMTDEHWKAFGEWVVRKIDKINPYPIRCDRLNPEDDALFIGSQWANANKYASRKMEKRMAKASAKAASSSST